MKTDILKQYVSSRDSLLKEKATLEARLNQINKALGAATTEAPAAAAEVASPAPAKAGKRAKRAKNSLTMKEAVVKALTGKAMTRQDLISAVKAGGYKFAAKDPLNSVSVMLYSDKKTFKNSDGKFSLVK